MQIEKELLSEKNYTGSRLIEISDERVSVLQKKLTELQLEVNPILDKLQENYYSKADVIYMTRVQKERFENMADYDRVKDMFLLKAPHLELMKQTAIIMHPLPRVNEIDTAIDADKRAAYFRQPENGLYIRMALLCEAAGV